MGQVVTIGLDIAKSVFQVHGVDSSGATVLRQRLTRSKLLPFFEKLPRCLVGIEACADPPPLKWSVLRYGFEPEEDRDGEQEAPA